MLATRNSRIHSDFRIFLVRAFLTLSQFPCNQSEQIKVFITNFYYMSYNVFMAYRIIEITKPAECHVTNNQLSIDMEAGLYDLPKTEGDTGKYAVNNGIMVT